MIIIICMLCSAFCSGSYFLIKKIKKYINNPDNNVNIYNYDSDYYDYDFYNKKKLLQI